MPSAKQEKNPHLENEGDAPFAQLILFPQPAAPDPPQKPPANVLLRFGPTCNPDTVRKALGLGLRDVGSSPSSVFASLSLDFFP